jgi:hypothetical protein
MTKRHMQRVADHAAETGCCVCGAPFAHLHHVLEGRTPGRKSGDMLVVPLCVECHTGPKGIHGDRLRWSLRKTDELKALNGILADLYGGR